MRTLRVFCQHPKHNSVLSVAILVAFKVILVRAPLDSINLLGVHLYPRLLDGERSSSTSELQQRFVKLAPHVVPAGHIQSQVQRREDEFFLNLHLAGLIGGPF
jgi:hypothetical protein